MTTVKNHWFLSSPLLGQVLAGRPSIAYIADGELVIVERNVRVLFSSPVRGMSVRADAIGRFWFQAPDGTRWKASVALVANRKLQKRLESHVPADAVASPRQVPESNDGLTASVVGITRGAAISADASAFVGALRHAGANVTAHEPYSQAAVFRRAVISIVLLFAALMALVVGIDAIVD